MSRWQFEDDPTGQADLAEARKRLGGDSTDPSSFQNAITNIFSPANPIWKQMGVQNPFGDSAQAGNSSGAPISLPQAASATPAATSSAAPAAAAAAGKSMTPGWASIISALIGFGGGALNGPDQQFKKSFDSNPATDPRTLLSNANAAATSMGQALTKRANQGVKLRTTV